MRHPSSIEPFVPSASVTLHPTLQAALENLDIQIDEELSRYRRQRQSSAASARKSLPAPSNASTNVSNTAIGILQSSIHLPTPRSSIYAELQEPKANAGRPDATSRPNAEPTASIAPTLAPQLPIAAPTAEALEADEPTRIPSYAQQHDLSAYTPNSALQKLVQASHSEPQGGYFASSEELLRSIAEENPERRAEREPNSMLDTLLTPLGIGSMLLLLLSSTTLGYVVMNPASLGLWAGRSSSDSKTSANPTASSTSKAANPSPDLAADEFVDLNLNTLSTLPKQAVPSSKAKQPDKAKSNPAKSTQLTAAKTEEKPTEPANKTVSAVTIPESIPPAPKPQTRLSTVVVPARPPVAATPKPAPAPPASVSPEPISAAPPSTATPTSPAPTVATSNLNPLDPVHSSEPAPAASSTSSNRYYVVTNYSGDASLQQARTAVPDAYVRNLPSGGAKVQLGSFTDAAQAEELQQQLQQQGIQAEVYQPR